MSDFVQPNKIYHVDVPDVEWGEINVSPAHDFLYFFQPFGAWVLKYMHQTEGRTSMHNIWMKDIGAQWLIEHCELEAFSREHMSEEEYNQMLEYNTETLSDADFELDFPEDL